MLILCVDGESEILPFYREALAAYDVHTVQSIEAAYEILASKPVDMVVTGRHLRNGGSGLALLERAASLRPTATRVLVTRETDHATGLEARPPIVQVVVTRRALATPRVRGTH